MYVFDNFVSNKVLLRTQSIGPALNLSPPYDDQLPNVTTQHPKNYSESSQHHYNLQ